MSLEITYGYKPEDTDRLYELEKACFSRSFRWSKADLVAALKTSDIWIGVYDGTIVGYVIGDIDKAVPHIVSLNVDPEHRRKGYAAALMGAAEQHYKGLKFKQVRLEVHVDNPAQILYFNLGYRVVGLIRSYYSNGSAAVAMEKQLKG